MKYKKLILKNYKDLLKDIIKNKISLRKIAANLHSIAKQIKNIYVLRCEKLVY
jgi:hypothetical protein